MSLIGGNSYEVDSMFYITNQMKGGLDSEALRVLKALQCLYSACTCTFKCVSRWPGVICKVGEIEANQQPRI